LLNGSDTIWNWEMSSFHDRYFLRVSGYSKIRHPASLMSVRNMFGTA